MGDITQEIELLRQGPMYFVDECFCVYNLTGTGIWSGKTTFKKIGYLLKNLEEYDEYTNYEYHKLLISIFKIHSGFDLFLDEPQLQVHHSVSHMRQCKRFIKLFIPPILLKIIHLPRDVIRFIKSRRKQ